MEDLYGRTNVAGVAFGCLSGHVAMLLLRRGFLGSDLPSSGFCEGGDGTK